MKYHMTKCAGNIVVEVDEQTKAGEITSSLKVVPEEEDGDSEYNAAIDGIEALVLACACEGIDIQTTAFQSAVHTAIEAAANNL